MGRPPDRSWGNFGPASPPPGSWRPYSDASPFNQLAAGAATHPASAAMVDRVLSWGAPGNLLIGDADTPDDFGHPVYFAQTTDPLTRLHATAPWGPNELEGLRIPVPAAALPAGGDDGHLTVVAPDGWEYSLWRAKRPAGGTLEFSWGGRTRIDGLGLHAGATAAGFGNLAGIIRPEELAAGRIDHALIVTVRCTSDTTEFGFGVRPHRAGDANSSFVYPADHGGSRCDGSQSAAPPMGARLALGMTSEEIAALPVPDWKRTVLTALARYGGYIGDTGGPGLAVQLQSGSSSTSFGREDPAVTYAREQGLPSSGGRYVLDLASGVDWRRLRVLVPPSP